MSSNDFLIGLIRKQFREEILSLANGITPSPSPSPSSLSSTTTTTTTTTTTNSPDPVSSDENPVDLPSTTPSPALSPSPSPNNPDEHLQATFLWKGEVITFTVERGVVIPIATKYEWKSFVKELGKAIGVAMFARTSEDNQLRCNCCNNNQRKRNTTASIRPKQSTQNTGCRMRINAYRSKLPLSDVS